MRRRALGVVVVVCGLGCGAATSRPATPATVVVLEPGAEPRRPLRYELAVGAAEREELSVKERIETTTTNTVLETGRQAVDLPTIRAVVRRQITAITPTGDAVIAWQLEAIEVLEDVVDPRARAAVTAEVAGLTGVQGTLQLSPTGAHSQVAYEAAQARPAQRARLDAIVGARLAQTPMFPDAAVGAGAAWQVSSRERIDGITWEAVATYRLRALTDTLATLDVEIDLRAENQALRVEPNATTRLRSGRRRATGELVIPRRGLVGTSTLRTTGEANLSIVRGRLRITATVRDERLESTRPAP